MTILLVFLGAAVGAVLRYLIDRAVQARHGSIFPWGTLTVNVAGCLVLGSLTGSGVAASGWSAALVSVGLLGALTTYSTFSYETVRLIEGGAWRLGLANALVSVAVGLVAVLLGGVIGCAFG